MGFVLCKYPNTRRGGEPVVRITKYGKLVFTKGAYRKLEDPESDYLRFFYDKDHNLLGIETCTKNTEAAVKIVKGKQVNSVSVKGVFAFYEKDYKDYVGRYKVFRKEAPAFLCVDLDAPIQQAG